MRSATLKRDPVGSEIVALWYEVFPCGGSASLKELFPPPRDQAAMLRVIREGVRNLHRQASVGFAISGLISDALENARVKQ